MILILLLSFTFGKTFKCEFKTGAFKLQVMAFDHGGAVSIASLKGDITFNFVVFLFFFHFVFFKDLHISNNAQAQTPTIS